MRSISPRPGGSALYTLILTADERRAFDWVGDRYNAGAVADLLRDCIPEGQPEWEDDGEIAFTLPSTWPGGSVTSPRRRATPGRASPRTWPGSSTTCAGVSSEP